LHLINELLSQLDILVLELQRVNGGKLFRAGGCTSESVCALTIIGKVNVTTAEE